MIYLLQAVTIILPDFQTRDLHDLPIYQLVLIPMTSLQTGHLFEILKVYYLKSQEGRYYHLLGKILV